MSTITTSRRYYAAQVLGWSVYVLISVAVFRLSGTPITFKLISGSYLVFALGITISHLYRIAIIKLGWLNLDFFRALPRVVVACLALAVLFQLCYAGIGNVVFGWNMKLRWNDPNILTWLMLFFIWNLIYFAYIFFQRYRSEEIKNLKLEAARNEYELRRLRDQMNPHFIFNAMNTIRALIDENPVKAKEAITKLSNVLRGSLQTGKHELIPLSKELEIVRDYLEIEKIRYEERLIIRENIDPDTLSISIPPLIVQTIVENGIKHGISTLPKGGEIAIGSRLVEGGMVIEVKNAGVFNPTGNTADALGLRNTLHRLNLSFGDRAKLEISNIKEGTVLTTLFIPTQNAHNKSSDN
ncbi:MAG: histidine kinase [Salibacteraceae bacterium]